MIDDYLATDIESTDTCSAIINAMPSNNLNHSIGTVNAIIDILNGFKRGSHIWYQDQIPACLNNDITL